MYDQYSILLIIIQLKDYPYYIDFDIKHKVMGDKLKKYLKAENTKFEL